MQPFLTDRNPAPSVVLKALIMRICTAVLHARPYSVELCCCSTVNGAGFCGGLFLEAPTAFGVTASELPCSNIKLVSALAAAVPDGFLPGLADVVRRPAGNRQKSEGLPGSLTKRPFGIFTRLRSIASSRLQSTSLCLVFSPVLPAPGHLCCPPQEGECKSPGCVAQYGESGRVPGRSCSC